MSLASWGPAQRLKGIRRGGQGPARKGGGPLWGCSEEGRRTWTQVPQAGTFLAGVAQRVGEQRSGQVGRKEAEERLFHARKGRPAAC